MKFKSITTCVSGKFYSLLIVDFAYYAKHEMEIDEWIINNSNTTPEIVNRSRRTGLIIDFKTESERTAFLLRWE